ncbi:MAG: transposase [Frankiales bacterium]|nr:transposase [Frankiales bacterium]
MAGIALLHELIGQHVGQDDGELDDPSQVVVGIETDRGPWVQALLAAGYQVFAINPLSVSRYRERHTTSGAKSDPGDAKVLADLVRTDRHHHRPIAGDTELAESIKVLARAHQGLCWMRGRQVNLLRSTLREFYPGALQAFDDLGHHDALAVLQLAPTPAKGRSLSRSKIASVLRRAGRQRNVETKAEQILTALRAPQLEQPPLIAEAFGATVTAYVALLTASVAQIAGLEGQLQASFGQHPAAEIVLSQPGLGPVLGARVLAEFGDDPHRYASPKARKNYAGTAPITRASGLRKVVLARVATNKRLRDALHLQAFATLSTSPGARAYYDARRADGHTHHQALRAVSNRLVGILHGCLRHGTPYDETTAWPRHNTQDQTAA